MQHIPSLIQDLALMLIVAGVVTILFKKLRQPLVLGYVVAGFLVSPHMPYLLSVVDRSDVQTWADIGVMFLLFALGLDFSIKKIFKMGASPFIATLTIVFSMMVLGVVVGYCFSWGRMDCIFLGGMLAMSSTTIIYKAFDDLGLRTQRFTSLVMSVLVLEDMLAIVMMVMLSAIAEGNNPGGSEMLQSILKIAFFLCLWFVVGIFVIPWALRSMRGLINSETLLIVSLGLCCLMAVISTKAGFSCAFGAFVMGSILAETVERDKIMRLVEPVKNLFGAVFFVSVGMLVNPDVLVRYALPIALLVLAIVVGQALFGTFGFLLSGQSLRSAMQCGFSMAQIGEFSFIIASLGLSLGVIGDFLYPVVVAVSVITTFLTPYMMRFAQPCYEFLSRHLPRRWIALLNELSLSRPRTKETSPWKPLLRQMGVITVVYATLSAAVIALMLSFFLPFVRHLLPHWWANALCGVATVVLISPFLRAMVMKKNHSPEFKALWTENKHNRLPLLFTILVRLVIATSLIFYVCNYLSRFSDALMTSIALGLIALIVMSRLIKKRSIEMERLFVQNLRSRDILAQVSGKRKPLYEGHLLDRDIHIADVEIPEDSFYAGKTLRQLQFRQRFQVHVSSILRGVQRINIPGADAVIFPNDRLQVIGSDQQLTAFGNAVKGAVWEQDVDIEKREMKLRQIVVMKGGVLEGKTLKESGIRNQYNCMAVGLEESQSDLTDIDPTRRFTAGDVLWVVGESDSLERLLERSMAEEGVCE